MSALPPYWVRFELRKKLVVIGWVVGWIPAPRRMGRSYKQPREK
jgi:hypothetical protein